MFNRSTTTSISALLLAAGLAVGPSMSAHAVTTPESATVSETTERPSTREPAGQYNFQCLLENGRTVNLGSARPSRGACKGWLQVYIGGKQVGHINTGGKLGPGDSVSCLVGAGLGLMSLFTGTTPIGWATLASLAVTGIGCSGH